MPTPSGHTRAIRAKKVDGTKVVDATGRKIGEVEDVALDKLSNSIMFAVLSFGGFLGIGQKYHPVPWMALDYDEEEDAYVVNFTEDQLRSAPADTIEELLKNDGTAYRDRAFAYYKVERYW